MFQRQNNTFELNINQRAKTYALLFNGSTITEGEYVEMENHSDCQVPYILFDTQFIWIENMSLNWE